MTPADRLILAHPVVLFDGACNFCNRSVRFVAERDRGEFRFASLQSPIGKRLLGGHGLASEEPGSVVLIEGERAWTRSTAALRIAKRLRFPWRMAYYLLIGMPAPMRDLLYSMFARWRYRLFGRAESCPMPDPELAQRFLDDSIAAVQTGGASS